MNFNNQSVGRFSNLTLHLDGRVNLNIKSTINSNDDTCIRIGNQGSARVGTGKDVVDKNEVRWRNRGHKEQVCIHGR